MGVHGLWPLLHPVARPVALETMGGKRLAIDSSIWLYQFQIAMRDKDGRALDNAHILGFLRRICKLLFYGIKPVFVFDGGAPLIKKLAISHRKNKKRGAKETAAKTAEKLLSAQLRAAAVAAAQKEAAHRETGDQIDEVNANYLDEDYGIQPRGAPVRRGTGSSPAKPAAANQPTDTTPPKRKYVHKDQYALPVIDEPLAKRAKPSDPRIATEAELRSFIDDMRPEDFDMDSEFFNNLPIEAKYEIIGDLRIKSRQSNFKRVEAMRAAPTPLDFSKAQILGLSHRNTLTQKLLTVTDSLSRVQSVTPMRVAGERNKEYVLIKNNDSQGAGYILGIREDGRSAASPVKIEGTTTEESDNDKTTTDEEFEAVPIPIGKIPRAASPNAAHRRDMAMEAIKQRYSPVKAKDVDSDDEDHVRKNGHAALFGNGISAHFVEDDDAAELPADLMAQIDSAVQGADEREDLRQAIQASIRTYEEQEAKSAQSEAESDVSFDEVRPDSPPKRKSTQLPENARVYTNTALQQRAETSRHAKTPSIEVVIPVRKQASPTKPGASAHAPLHASSGNGPPSQPSPIPHSLPSYGAGQDAPVPVVVAHTNGAATSKPLREQTPRPDLTAAQAERDISPQAERETADYVVQRDYAQQPEAGTAQAPRQPSPRPPPTGVKPREPSPVVHRPSLLERTLSQTSMREASPMEFVMPDEADLLPMPDLSAFGGELPPASTFGQSSDNPALNTAASTGKPDEVVYEWSASPEPMPRPQSFLDVSTLDPSDPRYIPADIELAEAGHELSDLEDEDREQIANVTTEQREYAKFLSELKNRNLDEMEFEAQNELRVLNQQNKKDRAMADDITQQMAKDIQTMLRVLGLPYVIAPMEAEAQCAELLSRSLVDGVITDDNDVFLFGATRVYKNMFNQNKYVECYLATDIERELALDRERLIRLAHFLGSDYCDGLPGVGPVLGMELMSEFPGADGLQQFRDWWLRVQRGKDTASDHPTAFKRKFKKSKRDIFLDESWPNTEVTKAYLYPQVDDSDEPFAWGIPDLDAMRDFLKDSLGWGPVKVDELLLPIIKRMTGRAAGSAVNQSTINSFFDVSGGTGRYAPMANKGYESKRLQAVVKAWRQSQKQLAKEESADLSLDESDFSDVAPKKAKQGSKSRTVSRQNSGTRSRSRASSSSRSRSRSVHSDVLLDQSDDDFHAQLEDTLNSMGIKRKREAPEDSDRIIKRATKGKRESGRNGRLLSRKASAEKRKRDKTALFASDSEASDYEASQASTSKRRSKKKSGSVRSSRVNSEDDM